MQRLPVRLVNGSQLTTGVVTYYTSPANTITTISACTLINTSGTAVAVTLNLVPSGGGATVSNSILSSRVIAAGESYNVSSAIGQTLEAGGFIAAVAGSGTSVTLIASGYATNP